MRILKDRKTFVAFGLMVLGWMVPVDAAAPTIVISVTSVDKILDNVDYVGGIAGNPGLKASAEQIVSGFTGGVGFNALNRDKPLGLYWSIPESGQPDPTTVIAFFPVSSVDNLKKLIGSIAPDLREKNKQWEMTIFCQKVFGRIADGYFHVSRSATALGNLIGPDQLVNPDYDFAIDVNMGSIPKSLKETFLKTTETEGRKGLENGPKPRNDAEEAGQKLGFEGMLAIIAAITNDGDKLTLGVNVEPDDHLATFELGLTGRADPTLAKSLSSYAKLQPVFSAVGESAPLQMVLSLPTLGMKNQLAPFVDAIQKTAEESIKGDPALKDDGDKAAATDVTKRLFNIWRSTLQSGSLEAVLMVEAGSDDTVRVVSGGRIAKGEEAGKLLDDILKLSKESPEYAKVKTDVDKYSGARIHAIEGSFSEQHVSRYGDSPAHMAFRADSLWVSFGGGNLEALKAGLDASAKPSTKVLAPISFRAKPATLVTLLEENNEQLVQKAESLAGEEGDVLTVEILATEKGGIKLRIEVGVDLILLGVD